MKVEGKSTRIYYIIKGQTTITEIQRNYLTALNDGGFRILASGVDETKNVSQKVGGRTFLNTFYANNPFPVDKNINILNGSSTSGGSFYIAAQSRKQDAEYFIVIGATQYKADEKVVMLDVIEKTAMEDNLINVNAAEMARGIRATGKIALYGIYFDFDKSDVKPESKVALDEIARLLQENPSLNLFIVGHTDMQGAFAYNMSLSEKRAKAVVDVLQQQYGISSNRLSAAGAGPLAPIGPNSSDAGRKLNRRVELVEKL